MNIIFTVLLDHRQNERETRFSGDAFWQFCLPFQIIKQHWKALAVNDA